MKREATPFASWTFLATFGLGLVCLTRAALVFWPRWGWVVAGGGGLVVAVLVFVYAFLRAEQPRGRAW